MLAKTYYIIAMSSTTSPLARQVFSADLGALKPRLLAASAADGVTPSAWLKRVLQAALDALPMGADGAEAQAVSKASGRVRMWLAERLLHQLDARCKAEGMRTRDDVIAALLGGALAQAPDVAAVKRGGASAAVAALIQSNAQLVVLGQNFNQLARLAQAGSAPMGFEKDVADTARLLREHVKAASTVAAELGGLVKLQQAKGPRKREQE